jgi:hypothetical protein
MAAALTLSKSNFKLGCDCPYKLRYYKAGYPSRQTEDDYLKFFAEGGFMVEAIAHALFPQGVTVEAAAGETELEATRRVGAGTHNGVWFEPTFELGKYRARIDMLVRDGGTVRLIEIKAKSYDSIEGEKFKTRNGISSEWRDYLLDAAFQTMVLSGAMPDVQVKTELCLVDRAKSCTEDSIYRNIEVIERPAHARGAARAKYIGNPEQLKQNHFLAFVDVSEYVSELMPEVIAKSTELLRFLESDGAGSPPPLNTNCRKCEYRGVDDVRHGFSECWKDLADTKPHVLDLYYLSKLDSGDGLGKMVGRGNVDLRQIEDSWLDAGRSIGRRQLLQVETARSGVESFRDGLKKQLESVSYPLRFVDFETSRIPVPYHAGMKPYEEVTFQFSCHSLESGDTDLEHFEWINVDDAYPNYEFAQQLHDALGNEGSILVWSHFEQRVMRDVAEQIRRYKPQMSTFAAWLDNAAKPIDKGGRVLDLMKLCFDHYCHPEMGGRYGIKYVLRAIWRESTELRDDPWFSAYVAHDGAGELLDPYQALPEIPFGAADEDLGVELEVVREGVGAMRSYQEMLYGLRRDNAAFKETQRDLLLQYCKLDTLAMVMIWKYWLARAKS